MKKIFILFMFVFLSACTETNISVEDFINNPDNILNFIEKCNTGEFNSDSKSCINAHKAKMIINTEEATKDFATF